MKPLRLDTMAGSGIGHYTFGINDDRILCDRELAYMLPIQDGSRVLDIGSGNGRDLNILRSRNKNITIVAADTCIWSLIDLPDDLVKVHLESKYLPFLDNSFDIAYANGVLCELADDDANNLLCEMKRVARAVYYSEIYPDHSVRTFNA